MALGDTDQPYMITRDEAQFEEWLGELYEEHSEEAVSGFRAGRLQSFFLDHPAIAADAHDALAEGRKVLEASPRSAFLLASVAAEVGLRSTLLQPIVFGLVHSETLASMVSELVMSHQAIDRYAKLLRAILSEVGGVDLESYHRASTAKTLWNEIKELHAARNLVVHRASAVEPGQAESAILVAAAVLESVFPQVAAQLGFHLHDGHRLCNQIHLPPELERFLRPT